MASAISTTPTAAESGVSGEFHTLGQLFLAARAARRRGFAADRLWFVGEPSTDPTGEAVGFVKPVSVIRELTGAGLVLGLLGGLLWALSVPGREDALATRLLADSLTGLVVGAIAGAFGGWAHLHVVVGKYLATATAGGALRLKIALPADLSEPERERRSELAERVLREAKAETIARPDGAVEVNSPQSPAYLA